MTSDTDPATDVKRLHASVRGRVQGVFFRHFVHTEAAGIFNRIWMNLPSEWAEHFPSASIALNEPDD